MRASAFRSAADLLKVDIKGAEVDVILDCADRLLDSGFRVHILPDVVIPPAFHHASRQYVFGYRDATSVRP